MEIKTDNPATSTLHDSACMDDGYQAEFDDGGVATVREAVGTALIEKYPGIEAVEEGSADGSTDADDEPPPDSDSADSDSDGADEPTDDNSDDGTNEVEEH